MQPENQYLKQIRKLTLSMIVSGALNILLLSFVFYLFIKERPPTPYFEAKPVEALKSETPVAVAELSNADILRQFKMLSMEQLISKLNNKEIVESGYTQRDLALGCLVTFHFFDLPRALIGHHQPSQHRAIQYGVHRNGKPALVLVYPGLNEEQFQSIVQFARTEKWPLTSRGLFLLVHRQTEDEIDPSLADAFYLTPEFLAVEMLFNRSEIGVEKSEILKILAQGNWQMLHLFTEEQRVSQDLSPSRRQQFLSNYIKLGSKPAASLLLKTDFAYAAQKLDDAQAGALLDLLTEKTPQSQQYAMTLLTSPRGDLVWQKAADRLYEYSGEIKPEKYNHHAALARFVSKTSLIKHDAVIIPEATPKTEAKPEPKTSQVVQLQLPNPQKSQESKKSPIKKAEPKPADGTLYQVQEGDSLWKIAKKENIDFETLKNANNLDTDFLKPGTLIKIPKSAKPFAVEATTTPAKPTAVSVKPRTVIKEGSNKKRDHLYVVQEGDSLWKIAKRFNVEMESIKALNRLNSDMLQPGSVLKIP
jgi:LysM repeat protein